MVLEHLFPEDWLERKSRFAFLLGTSYSAVGLLIAATLFPSDPALVALAFTALLLLPELDKIFSIEERQEHMDRKKVSWKELLKDDWDVIKIYLFLFFGVFFVYLAGSMLLPSLTANELFREQLEIRGAGLSETLSGQAVFTSSTFWDLLSNNFLVLVAIFIIALLTGDGGVFLLIWNASVWGTIFGVTARSAAEFSSVFSLLPLSLILLAVIPHTIIESLAYILANISGGIISKDVLLEKFESKRFLKVLRFNLYLLIAALVVLLIGAFWEAIVLDNFTFYQEIIQQSFLA